MSPQETAITDVEATDSRTDRRTFLKRLAVTVPLGWRRPHALLSQSQSPKDLDRISTHPIDGAVEVVTQNQYAYVAHSHSFKTSTETPDGLAVVDWHTPSRPRTVSTRPVDASAGSSSRARIWDVKVSGDVAGLANDGSPGGVALFDVSTPRNPVQTSFYTTETGIHNHFLHDKYAYLCWTGKPTRSDVDGDGDIDRIQRFGDTGMEIVDISDPTTPTRVGTWQLKQEFPAFANATVNFLHDLYVQDGFAYQAYWDAGIVVLDVSNPSQPELVTQFGDAPGADNELRPRQPQNESVAEYRQAVWQPANRTARLRNPPGNAHSVQPSPDGKHVYVGAEAYGRNPGGIDIWDVSDFDASKRVAHIDPPDIATVLSKAEQEAAASEKRLSPFDPWERRLLRTAHNFDVTNDRLYSSWFGGGVRVFNVTDPSDPTEIGVSDAEGTSFFTAVVEDETIIASDLGTGLVFVEDP